MGITCWIGYRLHLCIVYRFFGLCVVFVVSGTRFCECCSVFLGLDGVGDSFLGKNRIMGLNKSYCPSGCIFLLITELNGVKY
mgnify:CR=1 FL=1